MIGTGARLKFIRQHRQLTMKALGERLGFDEKSAAVRIAQWEQGTRNPNEDSIKQLAQVLEIAPERLSQHNADAVSQMIEQIIWSELTGKAGMTTEYARIASFMGEFLAMKAKHQSGQISNEDYTDWLLHQEERQND